VSTGQLDGGGGGGDSDGDDGGTAIGPSPSSLIARARGKSLGDIIVNGFGAAILAWWIAGINVLTEIMEVFTIPLDALGIEGGNIVGEFFGGIADIFRAGAVTTQQVLLPGQAWAVGPLTFALSAVAVGAALYVAGRVLKQPFTGDTVLGLPIDVPGLGADEDGEDEE
jgi:hypothetical protein